MWPESKYLKQCNSDKTNKIKNMTINLTYLRMSLRKVARICAAFLICFTVLYFFFGPTEPNLIQNKYITVHNIESTLSETFTNGHNITLVAVSCGDRLQETLTMVKSCIMLTKQHIEIMIFTDDKLIEIFNEKLSQWQEVTNNAFTFMVMPAEFPKENEQEWRILFRPCSTQRLFLPNLLSDVDSILYIDSDTLFLTPVEDIWEHFYNMNSSQMGALAPEHENPIFSYYKLFASHPYYGPTGVNAGVMLMNLTKMRQFQWVDYAITIYKQYKPEIKLADQDIMNIIFHFHPDKLYIYPCRYNFRSDHCLYFGGCRSAERAGVAILHGSRGIFHSKKQPIFSSFYRAFEEFQLGKDIYDEFFKPLENYLDLPGKSTCGISDIYLKNLRKFIKIKEDMNE